MTLAPTINKKETRYNSAIYVNLDQKLADIRNIKNEFDWNATFNSYDSAIRYAMMARVGLTKGSTIITAGDVPTDVGRLYRFVDCTIIDFWNDHKSLETGDSFLCSRVPARTYMDVSKCQFESCKFFTAYLSKVRVALSGTITAKPKAATAGTKYNVTLTTGMTKPISLNTGISESGLCGVKLYEMDIIGLDGSKLSLFNELKKLYKGPYYTTDAIFIELIKSSTTSLSAGEIIESIALNDTNSIITTTGVKGRFVSCDFDTNRSFVFENGTSWTTIENCQFLQPTYSLGNGSPNAPLEPIEYNKTGATDTEIAESNLLQKDLNIELNQCTRVLCRGGLFRFENCEFDVLTDVETRFPDKGYDAQYTTKPSSSVSIEMSSCTTRFAILSDNYSTLNADSCQFGYSNCVQPVSTDVGASLPVNYVAAVSCKYVFSRIMEIDYADYGKYVNSKTDWYLMLGPAISGSFFAAYTDTDKVPVILLTRDAPAHATLNIYYVPKADHLTDTIKTVAIPPTDISKVLRFRNVIFPNLKDGYSFRACAANDPPTAIRFNLSMMTKWDMPWLKSDREDYICSNIQSTFFDYKKCLVALEESDTGKYVVCADTDTTVPVALMTALSTTEVKVYPLPYGFIDTAYEKCGKIFSRNGSEIKLNKCSFIFNGAEHPSSHLVFNIDISSKIFIEGYVGPLPSVAYYDSDSFDLEKLYVNCPADENVISLSDAMKMVTGGIYYKNSRFIGSHYNYRDPDYSYTAYRSMRVFKYTPKTEYPFWYSNQNVSTKHTTFSNAIPNGSVSTTPDETYTPISSVNVVSCRLQNIYDNCFFESDPSNKISYRIYGKCYMSNCRSDNSATLDVCPGSRLKNCSFENINVITGYADIVVNSVVNSVGYSITLDDCNINTLNAGSFAEITFQNFLSRVPTINHYTRFTPYQNITAHTSANDINGSDIHKFELTTPNECEIDLRYVNMINALENIKDNRYDWFRIRLNYEKCMNVGNILSDTQTVHVMKNLSKTPPTDVNVLHVYDISMRSCNITNDLLEYPNSIINMIDCVMENAVISNYTELNAENCRQMKIILQSAVQSNLNLSNCNGTRLLMPSRSTFCPVRDSFAKDATREATADNTYTILKDKTIDNIQRHATFTNCKDISLEYFLSSDEDAYLGLFTKDKAIQLSYHGNRCDTIEEITMIESAPAAAFEYYNTLICENSIISKISAIAISFDATTGKIIITKGTNTESFSSTSRQQTNIVYTGITNSSVYELLNVDTVAYIFAMFYNANVNKVITSISQLSGKTSRLISYGSFFKDCVVVIDPLSNPISLLPNEISDELAPTSVDYLLEFFNNTFLGCIFTASSDLTLNYLNAQSGSDGYDIFVKSKNLSLPSDAPPPLQQSNYVFLSQFTSTASVATNNSNNWVPVIQELTDF